MGRLYHEIVTCIARPILMARTTWHYDGDGRLHTVTVVERSDQPLTTAEVTTYYYDAAGNLKDVVQSNGVVADYTYDQLNRLTDVVDFVDTNNNLTLDSGEAVKARFAYTLNADGTRSGETDTNDLGDVSTYAWHYDADGRLTSETWDPSDFDTTAGYITTYGFDLASNRVSQMTQNGASTSAIATFNASGGFTPDETITSAYDNNDRLLTVQDDAAGTANDTFTVYGYGPSDAWTMQTDKTVHAGLDDSGSVTSQTHFDYDDQGRMSQSTVTDGENTTVTNYAYDDSGIRIRTDQSTDGGTTTTTTEDLVDESNPTGYQQVLEERVQVGGGSWTLAKSYTLGLDVVSQNDATNGTLTFLYDGHGSTRALLNSGAAVVQRYAYQAFGIQLAAATLTSASSALTSLLYSGEQTDRSLGLQYLRARYYDPSVGRFTSFDSFEASSGDPLSLHKYLYAAGGPVLGVDPSGHECLVDTLTSFAINSIIAIATTPFVKPALDLIARALLPGDVLTKLETYLPSATMIGGFMNLNVAAQWGGIALGGGRGAGVEILGSPNAVAWYTYTQWQLFGGKADPTSLFRNAPLNVPIDAGVKVGPVFDVTTPSAYASPFHSVTLPLRSLPNRLRERMKMMTLKPVPLAWLDDRGALGRLAEKASNFLNLANKGETVTIFWGKDGDGFGFSFDYGYMVESNGVSFASADYTLAGAFPGPTAHF